MSECPHCLKNVLQCECLDAETSELRQEIARLREENAVLRSQVENEDINLEQVRMAQKAMWRTKLESAESEIARLTKELESLRYDVAQRDGQLNDLNASYGK